MDDTLILCYHAVASAWNDTVAVSDVRFTAQMALLRRLGYRGVTFTEAVTGASSGRRVAITFDDGFHSVLDRAWPILDRHGWPGTVFAVTDYADEGRLIGWPTLDRWRGTDQEHELRTLDWSELTRLQAAGWEIGSHTASHPHLTQLPRAAVVDELERSRRACEEHLAMTPSLAYPYGDVDPQVVAVAREVGYTVAAALPDRLHAPRTLESPRVGVYNIDHMARFAVKIVPLGRRLRTIRTEPATT